MAPPSGGPSQLPQSPPLGGSTHVGWWTVLWKLRDRGETGPRAGDGRDAAMPFVARQCRAQ